MQHGRVRGGEWLAAGSAVALLVTLLLPWFAQAAVRLTAWQAFSVLDVVLSLFALMGLGVAALAALRPAPAGPVAAVVVTAAVGLVLTVVLAIRIGFPPGPNELVGVRSGALLGLLCVIGVTAGAWHAMADERTDAIEPPFVPAQPSPPAVAPAGSLVAEGGVPDAADRD